MTTDNVEGFFVGQKVSIKEDAGYSEKYNSHVGTIVNLERAMFHIAAKWYAVINFGDIFFDYARAWLSDIVAAEEEEIDLGEYEDY